MFKKFVEYEYPMPDGPGITRFDWQKDFETEGLFHTWINNKDIVVAIVELPDGTVKEVLPENLKFVESPVMEPPVMEHTLVMEHTPVVDKDIAKSISDGIVDALTRINMLEVRSNNWHILRKIRFGKI